MRAILLCFLIMLLIGCTSDSQNQLNQTNNVSYKNKTIKHQENRELSKDPWQTDYSNIQKSSKELKVILDVPIIKQNPELKYGCEVTSLAMILQYAGVNVDKMELAKKVPKDNDHVIKDKKGNIIKWGNPNHGFVGDMTGKTMGYAVFVKPTEKLMRHYLPKRTVNLTNKPFEYLLNQIKEGQPVLTWVTGDFKAPDRWETWYHGTEKIKTPLDLHAVVLVGFDPNYVYVNDPLTGKKAAKINKNSFKTAWKALGKQALSYQSK